MPLINVRFFLLTLLLCSGMSMAAPDARNLAVGTAVEKRVALVIGNDRYAGVKPLEKAVNDARAMEKALQQAGFRTQSVINGTRRDMNTAINRFVDDVSGGGIGVFFFAGHGVQLANQNFLIPVDIQGIEREADVADQSISLQTVQDKLADAKAKFTLLVIDACRDNPLPRKAGRSVGASRGLAQASSAEGQIVVFAAGAHQQALDKLGPNDRNPNGVFTREFLPWIAKPGITIRDAVLGVRSAVRARARSVDHEQFPAIYDQAEGNFYFHPGRGSEVASLTPQLSGARTTAQIEDELWDGIKDSDKASVFEEYLRQYPNGRYVAVAKVKLKALQGGAVDSVPAPSTNGDQPTPGAVFKDCADCPEMVVIPAGSFEMGSNENFTGNADWDKRYKPVHGVRIGKAFALGKTEVTQGQWRAVMGSNPSHFSSCGDDCPVEQVNWDEALAYARKLSEKTGKSYRLPSEAEWEYACRAGGTHTHCGSDSAESVAWYKGNSSSKTQRVATKQPNAWGLYDMSGNVWEWTQDCWNETYSGAPTDGTAWSSGNCGRRVLRGGSWFNLPQNTRAADRYRLVTTFQDGNNGFRLARMLP